MQLFCAGVVATLVTATETTDATSTVMKGIAYGPVPSKHVGQVVNDDMFAEQARMQWSSSGRGDLAIMKSLGINMVRVYGNDASMDHKGFLDEAASLDIGVVVGFSNWPYTKQPGNCHSQGNYCYQQVKDYYASMLRNGFLQNGSYHSAIKYVSLINEPEIELGGFGAYGTRAVISAFDGLLDAEKEAGVNFQGYLPRISATFTGGGYGNSCGDFNSVPAVAQMANLDCGMRHPDRFQYGPKNDLGSAYDQRFVHSFNSQQLASSINQNILEPYKAKFGMRPVYIGEFHQLGSNTQQALIDIVNLAADGSNPFVGACYFEYQVSYYKNWQPHESQFGMLGLGGQQVGTITLGGSQSFPVWCLYKIWDNASGKAFADALAVAYGGPGVDAARLCSSVSGARTANSSVLV